MSVVIKIENLNKEYQLGTFGYGSLGQDIQSWWAKLTRITDPNSIIGKVKSNNDQKSNRILALNDINLEINQGEKIGIIGKNGAGKTTLLKILSQIASPTSGNICSKGRMASLIAVGTGFHKELTGLENIFLNGAILGLTRSEINERLEEIIKFSGIEKFIETPVKRYSTGMNIRLGFSVAAHLNPDILIIDEVLAVGDAEFQKKCIGSLNNSSNNEKTLLVVSHNLGMIRNLCEKVIVLESGRIIFSGNVEEGISCYMNSISLNNNNSEKDNLEKHSESSNSIIKSVAIKKENGNSENYFFQNEKFYIELKYKNNLEIPLSGAGFIIKSQDGIDIGESNTYMTFEPPYKLPESGLVKWELNANIFNPGLYILKIFICGDIKRQVDYIENAIQFTIEPSDIYETGYLTSTSSGFMTIQAEIQIKTN